jgi:hypothetical protein
VSILLQKGSQIMKLAVRTIALLIVLAGAFAATSSPTVLAAAGPQVGPDSLPIPLCGPGIDCGPNVVSGGLR